MEPDIVNCADCRRAAIDWFWDTAKELEWKVLKRGGPYVNRGPLLPILGEFWSSIQETEFAFQPLGDKPSREEIDDTWQRGRGFDTVMDWYRRAQPRILYLRYRKELDPFFQYFIDELSRILSPAVPEHQDGEALLTAPLITLLPKPAEAIEAAFRLFFFNEEHQAPFFTHMQTRLRENIERAQGAQMYLANFERYFSSLYKGDKTPERLVKDSFEGTPLKEAFLASVPLSIPRRLRFSHTHVLGGSGAGKTSLLLDMIVRDIRAPDSPSVVVIDPHSELPNKLMHADIGIEGRVIYIDPRDVEHPPAINVFAQPRKRIAQYDAYMREQLMTGVVDTFDYLFGGMFNAELTTKQSVPFRFMVRLLLSLPESGVVENGQLVKRNATLLDMRRLLDDPAPYKIAIARLPEVSRDFFLRRFINKEFTQTRDQIGYRLDALLDNPALVRFFTASHTKINLFKELNRGKIILIDCAQDMLGSSAGIFGRMFLSLILRAIQERATIPESSRKDTFLYIDEAQTFFDDNINNLLTNMRKYRCGVALAHHDLHRADEKLQSSLHANTSIKYASGGSGADATAMAREMRTTSEFILAQNSMNFAVFARGVTPVAASVKVERPNLRQLSPSRYEALIALNQDRVSLTPDRPIEPSPPRAPEDDAPPWEDPVDNWPKTGKAPPKAGAEPEQPPPNKGSARSVDEDISDKW